MATITGTGKNIVVTGGEYNDLYLTKSADINANSGKSITFNGSVIAKNVDTAINLNSDSSLNGGDYIFNNEVSYGNLILNNANVKLGSHLQNDGTISYGHLDLQKLTVNGGFIDSSNNHIDNHNLGNLVLNSDLNVKVDGDFANKRIDTIAVKSVEANRNHINISNINILTPTTEKNFSISPIGEISDSVVKKQLANTIRYTGGEIAMTPIYKYETTYNPDEGVLNFSRRVGSKYQDFNPAIFATPIMAQIGLQGTINSTTNLAFQHSDGFTKLKASDRYAIINSKKYALNDPATKDSKGAFSSTIFNNNLSTFSDAYENKGFWVRPYVSFENIPLKNGPKVGANFYGSLFGFDSDFKSLRNGWNTIFTGYLGYNGAYLTYNNTSSTMNGGFIGATQTWYKGNFWTALTATVGASVAENINMYGHDDNASILGGIGSKTGYNFEFNSGKLIVQPIWFMSTNFVKTFDYRNSAGVKIDSDPLYTIRLNPSIRIIGNLKNGWQPYISAGVVWDLMEGNSTKANGEKLPEMTERPFAEYGCGLQKQIGDRFTGFMQVMMHNGGRSGVAITGGFRWTLGKDSTKKHNEKEKVMKRTVLKVAQHN